MSAARSLRPLAASRALAVALGAVALTGCPDDGSSGTPVGPPPTPVFEVAEAGANSRWVRVRGVATAPAVTRVPQGTAVSFTAEAEPHGAILGVYASEGGAAWRFLPCTPARFGPHRTMSCSFVPRANTVLGVSAFPRLVRATVPVLPGSSAFYNITVGTLGRVCRINLGHSSGVVTMSFDPPVAAGSIARATVISSVSAVVQGENIDGCPVRSTPLSITGAFSSDGDLFANGRFTQTPVRRAVGGPLQVASVMESSGAFPSLSLRLFLGETNFPLASNLTTAETRLTAQEWTNQDSVSVLRMLNGSR